MASSSQVNDRSEKDREGYVSRNSLTGHGQPPKSQYPRREMEAQFYPHNRSKRCGVFFIIADMNIIIEGQIRSEIYRALELLGADRKLLAAVGSWGDTLDDGEVLELLTEWNEAEEKVRQPHQ